MTTREELKSLMEQHALKLTDVARIVCRDTQKPVSLRAVRCWQAPPGEAFCPPLPSFGCRGGEILPATKRKFCMKKHLQALLLASTIISPLAQAGGILVYDATSKLENARQWAKEAKQWMETAQHYKDQIQAYKEHMLAISGVRDVEEFVDRAKSLKQDLEKFRKPGQALNDLLLSGGSSGQFDSLYNKYKIFDACNAEQSQSYVDVCKQEVINKAVQIEQTDEMQKQVSSTLGEMNSLSRRVALSKDPKESQDLANAIQLKSVMLNTLTTQWEMSVKAAERREQLLKAERIKRWNQQQLNAPDIQFN